MRLLICYKNFSKECGVTHIGMGVTAGYCAKTLNQHGYHAEAKPIYGADDLTIFIQSQDSTPRPVTHVLIMAQWIPTRFLAILSREFPHIQFTLNCHSNVGFLQAEPPAIKLLREAIDLETQVHNFRASSNNLRLVTALQRMYSRPVMYLPNLYYLHGQEPIHRPLWNGGLLRIGCFGSLRIYKNFSTAIAAGIELTQSLKCHSEIWINSGRDDGAGNVVKRTAEAWTTGVSNVTLKELPWTSWPEFKRGVGTMNILMQPSFTETFNNVTADGVTEGTASVVGPSIEWVPESWKAEPDDTNDVCDTARRLLFDPHAVHDGYNHLKDYVSRGLVHWKQWLI